MRLLASLALTGLAVLVLLVLLVWWHQERIVFQPPRPPTDAVPAWARRVTYEADDGQPLFGYLVGPGDTADAAPSPRLVIAFHGNADLAVWQLDWARELARRTRARVLLAEYRGYGGLAGAPTYQASGRDARAAYAFARDSLAVPSAEVVLFGHSLGSAVATELAGGLAARGAAPRALVLQSPFTSARAMARLVVSRPVSWTWRAISRVHFDSERVVASLAIPVWVAHGERDLIVPVRMGSALHAAAGVKGDLLVLPRAGHNDVALVGGEDYWRWIARAVNR
jgi:uncharacterized protein